jgi:hypothetical protein
VADCRCGVGGQGTVGDCGGLVDAARHAPAPPSPPLAWISCLCPWSHVLFFVASPRICIHTCTVPYTYLLSSRICICTATTSSFPFLGLYLSTRIFTTDLRYDTHLRPHRSCTCTVHLLAHTTECKSISLSVYVHPSRARNTRHWHIYITASGTEGENIFDEPECSEAPVKRPLQLLRIRYYVCTCCENCKYEAHSAFLIL